MCGGAVPCRLEMQVCFLAVDSLGSCRPYGLGTWSCLNVSVESCRYSMGPGESFGSVAGLFETNWIQVSVACARAGIHTHANTNIRTGNHPRTYMSVNPRTYARAHAQHARTCVRVHTRTQTVTYPHTHASMHSNT